MILSWNPSSEAARPISEVPSRSTGLPSGRPWDFGGWRWRSYEDAVVVFADYLARREDPSKNRPGFFPFVLVDFDVVEGQSAAGGEAIPALHQEERSRHEVRHRSAFEYVNKHQVVLAFILRHE